MGIVFDDGEVRLDLEMHWVLALVVLLLVVFIIISAVYGWKSWSSKHEGFSAKNRLYRRYHSGWGAPFQQVTDQVGLMPVYAAPRYSTIYDDVGLAPRKKCYCAPPCDCEGGGGDMDLINAKLKQDEEYYSNIGGGYESTKETFDGTWSYAYGRGGRLCRRIDFIMDGPDCTPIQEKFTAREDSSDHNYYTSMPDAYDSTNRMNRMLGLPPYAEGFNVGKDPITWAPKHKDPRTSGPMARGTLVGAKGSDFLTDGTLAKSVEFENQDHRPR